MSISKLGPESDDFTGKNNPFTEKTLSDEGITLEELQKLSQQDDDSILTEYSEDSEYDEDDEDSDGELVYESEIKKIPKLESIRKTVREDMRELGTYDSSFNDAIQAYAMYKSRFLSAYKLWQEAGSPVEHINERGQTKRHPLLEEMDTASTHFGRYQDKLMLNPKAREKLQKDNTPNQVMNIFPDTDDLFKQ